MTAVLWRGSRSWVGAEPWDLPHDVGDSSGGGVEVATGITVPDPGLFALLLAPPPTPATVTVPARAGTVGCDTDGQVGLTVPDPNQQAVIIDPNDSSLWLAGDGGHGITLPEVA